MKCLFAPSLAADTVAPTGHPFSFEGLFLHLRDAEFTPSDNGFILPPSPGCPSGTFVHGFPFAFALYIEMQRRSLALYGDALTAQAQAQPAVRLWMLFGATPQPHACWPINSLAYRVHLSLSVNPFTAHPVEQIRKPQ